MRRITPFLLIFLTVLLDLGILTPLKEFYVFPFFTLFLVIYFTFYRSFAETLIAAAIGGFALDTFSSFFGLHMIAFFLVAWIIHVFVRHAGKPSLGPLITASALTVLLLASVSLAMNLRSAIDMGLLVLALPPAGFTALAAALTYPLWNKFFEVISYYETTIKLPGKML